MKHDEKWGWKMLWSGVGLMAANNLMISHLWNGM